MERAVQRRDAGRSAVPGGRERPSRQAGGFTAVSPEARAQTGLQAAANDSPRARQLQAYQRMADHSPQGERLRSLQAMADGGSARPIQRTPTASAGVVQRTSLNGVLVDPAVPYPNGNQAAVLTHMAGEWGGANGGAVTGGHLLNEMVAAWGPAVANSANPNNASPAGVHFAGGLPGDNITPHQHTFRLATQNPGNQQTNVSLAKQSTFWPSGWNNAELTQTLNNSFRNGAANTWASKENMSYWYRWQTLGANTLFPIEKVATATGTDRNRMKAGRL